jgi:hypothetical protein
MAELETSAGSASDSGTAPGGERSQDQVALDLMKFITLTTGYGKASQSSAGFSGKPVARLAEEHAEALLELFERCRRVVKKQS